MSTQSEFKQAHTVVLQLLAENPLTRDDHLTLLIGYWQSIGVDLSTTQIARMTAGFRPETIRRTAQKIQNVEKTYEPSKTVKAHRLKKEQEMRVMMKQPIYGIDSMGKRELLGYRAV